MKRPSTTHERLTRDEQVRGSSNRTFGLVLAGVFSLIGLWPLVRGGEFRLWSLAFAVFFLLIALTRPRLLAPLNRVWTKLGRVLHRIVNPVVMGVLFYLVVTPTGLMMRLLGKDLLRLRFEPNEKSYWIERQPPGPAPESMKQQF
ncbi:MAG TPA: SxtJ family membrane protein [Kiloniellales bacterium]|jgi:hypothetical protein